MSMVSNSTTQSTIMPWDSEPVKVSMKQHADAFIDAAQPHVAAFAKTVAVVVATTSATAGGTSLKTSITSSCPNIAPAANAAIDASTVVVIDAANQIIPAAVDSSVAKVGVVAKEAVHNSIDAGVAVSARSIPFFG